MKIKLQKETKCKFQKLKIKYLKKQQQKKLLQIGLMADWGLTEERVMSLSRDKKRQTIPSKEQRGKSIENQHILNDL